MWSNRTRLLINKWALRFYLRIKIETTNRKWWLNVCCIYEKLLLVWIVIIQSTYLHVSLPTSDRFHYFINSRYIRKSHMPFLKSKVFRLLPNKKVINKFTVLSIHTNIWLRIGFRITQSNRRKHFVEIITMETIYVFWLIILSKERFVVFDGIEFLQRKL